MVKRSTDFVVHGEFRGHEWTASWVEVARVRSAWSTPVVSHAWRAVWQRQQVTLVRAPAWDGETDEATWRERLQPFVEREFGPPSPDRYRLPRA